METKQIVLNIDKQLFETAEMILEDIGIDFQSSINIFLKRLVKEQGIAFLLQDTKSNTSKLLQSNVNKDYGPVNDVGENYMTKNLKTYYRKNNSVITEEMRDYIWTIFKENKYVTYTVYKELAKNVYQSTEMNEGSAYIYFIILSCFMEGKFNTRTMKFSDLEYYIKKILQECAKIEFKNTLISLESSIPYWEEHLNGNFAIKVQQLVNKYKAFLSK